MDIRLSRAYDTPGKDDGARILVDRLWPRGVKKEDLALDDWLKEIAPSDDLRKWFDHDPERWQEFRNCYAEELKGCDKTDELLKKVKAGRVTLVFGAKDESHNNAVALRDWLREKIA